MYYTHTHSAITKGITQLDMEKRNAVLLFIGFTSYNVNYVSQVAEYQSSLSPNFKDDTEKVTHSSMIWLAANNRKLSNTILRSKSSKINIICNSIERAGFQNKKKIEIENTNEKKNLYLNEFVRVCLSLSEDLVLLIDVKSGVIFCLVAAHCSAYFDKFSEFLCSAKWLLF